MFTMGKNHLNAVFVNNQSSINLKCRKLLKLQRKIQRIDTQDPTNPRINK